MLRFTIAAASFERIRGGIERHAVLLRGELEKRGHAAVIVPYHYGIIPITDASDYLVVEGVTRFHLLVWALRGTLRPERSVIFTHGSFSDSKYWRRLFREGYFGSPSAPIRYLFDRALMGWILRKFGWIITLSERESSDLRSLFRLSEATLHALQVFGGNAPRTQREETRPGRFSSYRPYICSLSRVHRLKNLPAVIEAIRGLDLRFVLAGSPSNDLNRVLRASGTLPAGQFAYLGVIEDDPERDQLLLESEGLILPSFLEGLPVSSLEALSCGKPVIVPETCYVDPHPGVFFSGPDPASIRSAIRRLLTSTTAVDASWIKDNSTVCGEFLRMVVASRKPQPRP